MKRKLTFSIAMFLGLVLSSALPAAVSHAQSIEAAEIISFTCEGFTIGTRSDLGTMDFSFELQGTNPLGPVVVVSGSFQQTTDLLQITPFPWSAFPGIVYLLPDGTLAPGDYVIVNSPLDDPVGRTATLRGFNTIPLHYSAGPIFCEDGEGDGRFTGGGHQIRVDGVRVTRGLTIHCDLLLSNNLEVNWQGNSFHMTEHLLTVECSDDPNIIQFPPAAPLDTLIGIGTGRYNNQDGFTIEFTLVDAGEPGRDDKAALLIYETANPGNVVLDVPLQLLDGGNLNAHFDQPHK